MVINSYRQVGNIYAYQGRQGRDESSRFSHFQLDHVKMNLCSQIILKKKIAGKKMCTITLRIEGYQFSSQLTANLNLCPIYLKLLVHVL